MSKWTSLTNNNRISGKERRARAMAYDKRTNKLLRNVQPLKVEKKAPKKAEPKTTK